MLTKFNFEKLYNKLKRNGHTDNEIAGAMGITYTALRRKLNGDRTMEITASQASSLCTLAQAPMDMFIQQIR